MFMGLYKYIPSVAMLNTAATLSKVRRLRNSGFPSNVSRRGILRAGAIAGVGLTTATLAGCGTGSDSAAGRNLRGPVKINKGDPQNYFGVDGSVPLDVTIFKGGYSDEYATDGHERLYKAKFGDAKINHVGTQQISEVAGPRFRSYDPPDVLHNGGGERIELDQLADEGQLTDLTLLLEAPSLDDPKVKVKDTLRPSVARAGKVGDGDAVWGLPYDFAGYGLWYSQRLFDDNGWSKPDNWTEFMQLCAQIKDMGLAPFTYQGQYPYYMVDSIVTLAARHGGVKVYERLAKDFDSAAWGQESVKLALSAWEDFVSKGYVLEGSRDLTHLEAQEKWATGEAVFVPCGSWLENEEKQNLTKEFDLGFMPVPPLEGSAEPKLVQGSPGEHFVVPRYAKNPAGALEYLRIMLSSAGCDAWISHTSSLNAVADTKVESDRPGVAALKPYLDDDENLYTNTIEADHGSIANEVLYPAISSLMVGNLTADEFVKRMKDAV
jgi:N-acetylglucosamine transport system substrate-binding protein